MTYSISQYEILTKKYGKMHLKKVVKKERNLKKERNGLCRSSI